MYALTKRSSQKSRFKLTSRLALIVAWLGLRLKLELVEGRIRLMGAGPKTPVGGQHVRSMGVSGLASQKLLCSSFVQSADTFCPFSLAPAARPGNLRASATPQAKFTPGNRQPARSQKPEDRPQPHSLAV